VLQAWMTRNPVSNPATYKEYAADCLTAMRAAVLPEVKAMLLGMAQQWNEFAQRAENRTLSQPAAPELPKADRN